MKRFAVQHRKWFLVGAVVVAALGFYVLVVVSVTPGDLDPDCTWASDDDYEQMRLLERDLASVGVAWGTVECSDGYLSRFGGIDVEESGTMQGVPARLAALTETGHWVTSPNEGWACDSDDSRLRAVAEFADGAPGLRFLLSDVAVPCQ